MKMIVGLGNPGPKYSLTRHNLGFMVIDALIRHLNLGSEKQEKKAFTWKGSYAGESILLVQPQTYMNLSGQSVSDLAQYYKIEGNDLLVIHDEVDLPYHYLKFQKNRGHGGHNGIRDIHQMLNTNAYPRLRLGVSRPPNPKMDVADYLLSPFSKEEMATLPDFVGLASEAVLFFIENGFDKAANEYNNFCPAWDSEENP